MSTLGPSHRTSPAAPARSLYVRSRVAVKSQGALALREGRTRFERKYGVLTMLAIDALVCIAMSMVAFKLSLPEYQSLGTTRDPSVSALGRAAGANSPTRTHHAPSIASSPRDGQP